METKFYELSELFEIKEKLLIGDKKTVNKVITEIKRLEEVIKDYELGMKMLHDKFMSKQMKEPIN